MYPTLDIFLAEDNGKIVKKLTDTPGYDAEATINWKNKQIIYTSLASGDLDVWTHEGGRVGQEAAYQHAGL